MYFLQNGTKEKIVMEIDETIFPNDVASNPTFISFVPRAGDLYIFAELIFES